MLPVLILCLLIQLAQTFKARALPNMRPRDPSHSFKSDFPNVLDNAETDEHLSRSGFMDQQPTSLIIGTDEKYGHG
jgi:hypothetical protein